MTRGLVRSAKNDAYALTSEAYSTGKIKRVSSARHSNSGEARQFVATTQMSLAGGQNQTMSHLRQFSQGSHRSPSRQAALRGGRADVFQAYPRFSNEAVQDTKASTRVRSASSKKNGGTQPKKIAAALHTKVFRVPKTMAHN